MAKNFLIPIDMNSMEIMNFAVHNVSTLPTAVNGRLVYQDGVLKFGYTANGTTKWTTLLDDARLNMADYKKWSETKSYLSTNFYDKTSVDNLLTGYVKSTDYSTWKTSVDNTLEILTGSSDSNGTINKWKELEAFLSGFTDSESASLKEQLDAKATKGPTSATSGFASATTYTPTLYGSMTTTSKSGKAYRRITVDENGNLASEMYKFVIDFTVGSANTATYTQMQSATFLGAFGTTAGTNGFQELVVQVYKVVNNMCYEIAIDVRQDQAGVVITWGTAPKDGTYRVIVMR